LRQGGKGKGGPRALLSFLALSLSVPTGKEGLGLLTKKKAPFPLFILIYAYGGIKIRMGQDMLAVSCKCLHTVPVMPSEALWCYITGPGIGRPKVPPGLHADEICQGSLLARCPPFRWMRRHGY